MRVTLTPREYAFYDLCMSDSGERAFAIDACRTALGRALITTPEERAAVALAIAELGGDGLGRVALGLEELNAAAKADGSFCEAARG